MADFKVEQDKIVTILYTNWKGKTSLRQIIPVEVKWESSEWHPELQWILSAWDVEKGDYRSFAMKDIRSWYVDKPE